MKLFYPIYRVDPASEEYGRLLTELRKEARMLASVAHPNILEYIGITIGTDGSPKHIVTELATCTLDKYWEDRPGSLTLEVLLHVCEDLFGALEYLHTRKPQSVIHCDIKVCGEDDIVFATHLFPIKMLCRVAA